MCGWNVCHQIQISWPDTCEPWRLICLISGLGSGEVSRPVNKRLGNFPKHRRVFPLNLEVCSVL